MRYLSALELGMVEQQDQPTSEFRSLRTAAAQTRLRAIQSQIAIGLTLCNIAKSELQNGHADHAHEMVEKLRRHAQTIDRHVNEPKHVPDDEIGKLRIELAQLESAILALEEREHRNSR